MSAPPGLQEDFRKMNNTMPSPGIYSLNLYCDHENPDHGWNEFPHEYQDELGSRCRSKARRRGWTLHQDGTATCPKCNARLKRGEKPSKTPK